MLATVIKYFITTTQQLDEDEITHAHTYICISRGVSMCAYVLISWKLFNNTLCDDTALAMSPWPSVTVGDNSRARAPAVSRRSSNNSRAAAATHRSLWNLNRKLGSSATQTKVSCKQGINQVAKQQQQACHPHTHTLWQPRHGVCGIFVFAVNLSYEIFTISYSFIFTVRTIIRASKEIDIFLTFKF